MKILSKLATLFLKYVRNTTPFPQILGMCIMAWTLMFTTMPRFGEPERTFIRIIGECIVNLFVGLTAYAFVFFVLGLAIHFLFYLEKRDWTK